MWQHKCYKMLLPQESKNPKSFQLTETWRSRFRLQVSVGKLEVILFSPKLKNTRSQLFSISNNWLVGDWGFFPRKTCLDQFFNDINAAHFLLLRNSQAGISVWKRTSSNNWWVSVKFLKEGFNLYRPFLEQNKAAALQHGQLASNENYEYSKNVSQVLRAHS